MSKKNKKRFKSGRRKKGLNFEFRSQHQEFFQNVFAEREDSLDSYYVDNEFYQRAISNASKKAFFIGRTGSGKTAILEKVRKESKKTIISINPEDFAFKIMERSPLLKKLTECQINLDLFYKTMWKYIFITEILKRIYGNQRKSWFQEKIGKYIQNTTATRAYKFLLENKELEEGLPFSQRITKIIEKMEHSITAQIGSKLIELKYEGKINPTLEQSIYEGLKNFEFTDLNYFLKHLDEDVLDKYHFTILIDDLDKNWIQNNIGITFTRCLFETIFDINNTNHLRLLVSLRTNLFIQLEFSQSEKFLPYIDHISWKEEQIKKIVEKRFVEINIESGSDVWEFIFPKEITKDHKRKFPILKYLLDRSNMRPRDILIFISFAIKESIGSNVITSEAILKAEKFYSKNRLEALNEEWKNPYMDLSKIFYYFLSCRYKMTKSNFENILDAITLKVLEKDDAKNNEDWSWIIEGEFINKDTFSNKKLINLMYRIGFIGIKSIPSQKVSYIHHGTYYDDIPPISNETKFYINPCYHSAINVKFYEN